MPMMTAAMLSAAKISTASCGLRAGRAGLPQAGIAGNQQRQSRQCKRQGGQEEKVEAVGEEQAELGDRPPARSCR